MPLILKENAHVGNACRTLYFTDTTGLYSVTNIGGWNNVGGTNPNILISSVTSSNIIITLPDGVTTVTITNPVGIPSSNNTFEYAISATTVSSGSTYIADGLYQIQYTVVSGGTTYTTGKRYFLFTCNVECCVHKMSAKIATASDCSCDSTIIKNALYASALLKGLLANKDCGNITAINSLLTKLKSICNFSDTDCGCGS